MQVAQKLYEQISRLPDGTTFKYQQLNIEPPEFEAAAKAIERLVAKGSIRRISKGVFYKPKMSVFGELKPSESEILKLHLFDKGKRVAYITGTALYNKLGLTTQVPNDLKIASRVKRIKVSSGRVKASPVKSYVDVNDGNYELLGLLDALKDFKKIADLDKSSAIKILSTRLRALTPLQTRQILRYSLSYPPRVRAFLGALLESLQSSADLDDFRKSINPFSEFDYGIESIVPVAKKWRVK